MLAVLAPVGRLASFGGGPWSLAAGASDRVTAGPDDGGRRG